MSESETTLDQLARLATSGRHPIGSDAALLQMLADQELTRRARIGEVDLFTLTLKSHASIDREWLAGWIPRLYAIVEGQR